MLNWLFFEPEIKDFSKIFTTNGIRVCVIEKYMIFRGKNQGKVGENES